MFSNPNSQLVFNAFSFFPFFFKFFFFVCFLLEPSINTTTSSWPHLSLPQNLPYRSPRLHQPILSPLRFRPKCVQHSSSMAISTRGAAFSVPKFPNPNPAALPISNASLPLRRRTTARLERARSREATALSLAAINGGLGSLRRGGGGGAVLERPTFDQSQFDALPLVQEGVVSLSSSLFPLLFEVYLFCKC